jgi:hypothetical protein
MDGAAGSKAASLASAKVVKNAKGNIVPSSQMAHIVYGCGMWFKALKDTSLTPARRTHGRDVRECAQTDPPALSIDPPAHTR